MILVAQLIQNVLMLCLSGVIAYFLKENIEVFLLNRKLSHYRSVIEAQSDYETIVAKLDKLDHASLMGFSFGVSVVYIVLVRTGSDGFESKNLVFPLVGILLAGGWKPVLTMLFERRKKFIEHFIENYPASTSIEKNDRGRSNNEGNYEIIDQQ